YLRRLARSLRSFAYPRYHAELNVALAMVGRAMIARPAHFGPLAGELSRVRERVRLRTRTGAPKGAR
ncbi:MAG: hypothetical protein ACOCY8_05310, partial [Spirochaetota bacterium]